jgi:hypothetical protein
MSPIEYPFRSGTSSKRICRIVVVPAKKFLIKGITHTGKVFRPSDWAERLCGVMSAFRPPGQQQLAGHLQYSPYVVPTTIGNMKCVIVDQRLEGLEPMAMDFVISFARDNDLPFEELSEDSSGHTPKA